MRPRAALCLAAQCLAACSSPEAVIQPTLQCHSEVKCHVINWSVGLRPLGSYIAGQHADCRCEDRLPVKPYAYEKGRV